MSKLWRASSATMLYLIVLVAAYVVHVRLLPVKVVFYSALQDVAFSVAIAASVLYSVRWFAALGAFEKALLVVTWALAGYALAISVPAVIDRSLSFYILEKLAQRGGVRATDFESLLKDEFMREYRVADARLTEQLESGTIEIVDGCVILTQRGRRVAAVSRHFRALWLPRHRLLGDEYTDALTDPLRDAPHSTLPRCGVPAGAPP